MRTLSSLCRLGLGLGVVLGLGGCPDHKAPEPATTTISDTQSASKAVGERLHPGSGLPTDPAVKAIQRGLEQNEKLEQRGLQKAEQAGKAE